MKHDTLVAFLSGTLSPEALTDELADEVATFYADLRTTKHAFIDISSGPEFVVTTSAARRLLEAVAAQRLPQETAVYVADCMVTSDDIEFADDDVREAISLLEDDSRRFVENDGTLWTEQEIERALSLLA